MGEIIQLENLGFCAFSDGGQFPSVAKQRSVAASRLTPRVASDQGHPIGATGLGQIHELVAQLRGEAGPRQVEGETELPIAGGWRRNSRHRRGCRLPHDPCALRGGKDQVLHGCLGSKGRPARTLRPIRVERTVHFFWSASTVWLLCKGEVVRNLPDSPRVRACSNFARSARSAWTPAVSDKSVGWLCTKTIAVLAQPL